MQACVEFIVTFKTIITITRQHCITSERTIFFESLGSSCLSVFPSVCHSIYLSVCLSDYLYVRMEQHGSHCKDFHNIFFILGFLEIYRENPISVNCDKNNFTLYEGLCTYTM